MLFSIVACSIKPSSLQDYEQNRSVDKVIFYKRNVIQQTKNANYLTGPHLTNVIKICKKQIF